MCHVTLSLSHLCVLRDCGRVGVVPAPDDDPGVHLGEEADGRAVAAGGGALVVIVPEEVVQVELG